MLFNVLKVGFVNEDFNPLKPRYCFQCRHFRSVVLVEYNGKQRQASLCRHFQSSSFVIYSISITNVNSAERFANNVP